MTDVTEAKETVKNLESKKPAVVVKAAEKIMAEVGYKETAIKLKPKKPERKTIFVELLSVTPTVVFTGKGWCAVDIKIAYAAIVRKFRENLRELYRKEYKKK